jgi:uncharacterized membrane protein YgcG
MADHFRKGEYAGGLVAAIGEAGRQLAEHFPYDASYDVNELADDVDFGETDLAVRLPPRPRVAARTELFGSSPRQNKQLLRER